MTHGQTEQMWPNDLEAEQVVLGCALLEPECGRRVVEECGAAHFWREAHQHIFEALAAAQAEHGITDLVLAAAVLRREGRLAEVGGAEYLTALIQEVPTTAHLPRYLGVLHRCHHQRELIRCARTMLEQAADPTREPAGLAARATEELERLTERMHRHDRRSAAVSAITLAETLERVQWLWPGWVPRGALTIIAGQPGSGKSALALWLARCAMGGDPWPDGQTNEPDGAPVIYCDTEANQRLLIDRVRAWGGFEHLLLPGHDGLGRVALDDDVTRGAIRCLIRDTGARMLVIDTLRTAFRGDENSSEVVEVLTPWVELAQREDFALVVVHHYRKAEAGRRESGVDAVRGSSALPALARSIISLQRTAHGDGEIAVRVEKSNFAALPDPLLMRLHPDRCCFREDPSAGPGETQTEAAVSALRAILSDGPRPVEEVEEIARDRYGVAARTLYRARAILGVASRADSRDARRRWWELPEHHIAGRPEHAHA